uniref:Uncharacterized protein LOC111123359 n=1 Tax=Crassostrea virginica TaxID=6565 RepID=A0A8B8CZN4_CRAVI|nr:uncharacterized protein LOC111123359 [Crassostrea virginica]
MLYNRSSRSRVNMLFVYIGCVLILAVGTIEGQSIGGGYRYCSTRYDCESHEDCRGRRCVPSSPQGQYCRRDYECGIFRRCRQGRCESTIGGQYCRLDYECGTTGVVDKEDVNPMKLVNTVVMTMNVVSAEVVVMEDVNSLRVHIVNTIINVVEMSVV